MKNVVFCIDSDGCVMDTMTYKHQLFFGPIAAQFFMVKDKEKFLKDWNFINLYSETRGINRFLGLVKTLEKNDVHGIEALKKWVNSTNELSNYSLKREIKKHTKPSFDLIKALNWSESVNEEIKKTEGLDKTFPEASNTLRELKKHGEIFIVSSANKEAVSNEWKRHGLYSYVDELCCQDKGKKEEIICGIKDSRKSVNSILMIGDSPGDLEAANKNGVNFYPILVGKEKKSWITLKNKALPIFLSGEYTNLERDYINEFWGNLKKDN
ncbi:HAD family hydrolase [Enterococcus hirae]|nr:HAD family hydrolase [Enterococcus hirae]